MLDIFLPSDKRPNGQITIYDYLDSGDKAKIISGNIWWAKLFGIYHQANSLLGDNKYMGILETTLAELKANDNILKLYSTLNYCVGGIQDCARNHMVTTVVF